MTGKILDYLNERGWKAVFFLVGERIEQEGPEMIIRMIQEGHAIGAHGWDHKDLVKLYKKEGANAVREQIQRTSDAIFEIIGARPKFFRPPYAYGRK